MTPDVATVRLTTLQKWIDSCHCTYLPEPTACDGWLQHRKCDKLADALLTLYAQTVAAVEAELEVIRQIDGTFWEALKPLGLTFIRVENPGSHVTDVISERDDLRAQVQQAEQAKTWADEASALACADRRRAEQAHREAVTALTPFASGGDWGTVKAWIVEGARTMGNVSGVSGGVGLDVAQRITRWQVAVDGVLAATKSEVE